MKVFAVFEGYEDLIGVFSAREKAEAYITAYMTKYKTLHTRRDNFSILEHILDDPTERI